MDEKKTSDASKMPGISEADRMAKIRDLLLGPVIADESARVDRSVGRLDDLAKEQRGAIADLKRRLDEFEQQQRAEVERLEVRILGLVEALLADENEIRARLRQHDTLRSRLPDRDDAGNE